MHDGTPKPARAQLTHRRTYIPIQGSSNASPECPLMAEAVEKLFGALKLRLFGNERKFDSNKINSLGIQQFGNARRFRLKTGFSGVLQQPRLLADIHPHSDLRPLYPRKQTFGREPQNVCF